MQQRSNPPPRQTFSQEEPVSSSINHVSVSPSKMASHTCEESTLGLSSAAIQLLLLVILLYAAHIQYPQLHPGFLVACGAAFILLFVRRSWVSGFSLPGLPCLYTHPARHTTFVQQQAATRPKGSGAPTANPLVQQQTRQHTIQPRTPNLTGVWIKVTHQLQPWSIQLKHVAAALKEWQPI